MVHGGRRAELTRQLRPYLQNPLALFGFAILAVLLITAIFAPVLAPYDPRAIDLRARFAPPGGEHPFGTDAAGSDVLSRVIHGSRLALMSGVVVLVISALGGSLLGLFAGFRGGWVDEVLMRITDMFLAFPGLILAMAVVAALQRRGILVVVVAIAIRWWAPYARMMRAQVLTLRELDYVEAARAVGVPRGRILLRHILPNAMSPIIVQATLDLGYIILTAAALSFLGFGAQPGEPDWGRMVADGREHLRDAWWVVTFPGLAILFTVMAFNLVGDAARDIFDPRLHGG
ncbi:MAG: ABC-type dipeptide/oligopeptide/nickel transport system, permease component [Thermomicrobiales bacterium]|jgi:peptide/nickel transport system permease protein|nr:ABC-type dipeptide/oligopeptide/nickel transport system, permease component [Thermomicrobiales bacterium]